ncbi:MAG TPA: ABC transporter permease [Ignavibacteria bacterium]|nr:ABC transporter permease [Ignavibacteria bacterium]
MSIFKIVIKNIFERKLSSFLTIVSTMLGVGLIISILIIREETKKAFDQSATGYELIIGPKGSPLQLTLNTVFHIGLPVNNMPYKTYELLKADRRIKTAIPYVLGDNYKNHRIIGTTSDLLNEFEFIKGKKYTFKEGKTFENKYDAVLGSDVAEKTGLKTGDKFTGSHGVESYEFAEEHNEHDFIVTGILEKTYTPNDNVIFTSLESVWDIHYHIPESDSKDTLTTNNKETHIHNHSNEHNHNHDHNHIHNESDKDTSVVKTLNKIPEERKTISVVLVSLKSPVFFDLLRRQINDDKFDGIIAQAVIPLMEIKQLFDIIGNINSILLLISYLVIIVAVISILVSIYNTINERRNEIAIMRSLGAGRKDIFSMIILEGFFITGIGSISGFIIGHLAVYLMSSYISEQTGVYITGLMFGIFELYLVLGTIILGITVSILPAIKAYRTDVATNL